MPAGFKEIISIILLLSLFLTMPLIADDARIIGKQYVEPLNGPCQQFFIVQRGENIEFLTPLEARPLLKQAAEPSVVFVKGLIPQQVVALPMSIGDIKMKLNNHVNVRRDFIIDVVDRYVNGMTRSKWSKPKVVIEEDVPNLDHYINYHQIQDDGINTIYAHPDDRTFASSFRGKVAAAANIYFDLETGEYHGVDIAMTYAFLNDQYYKYLSRTLPHEFGHVYGYSHSGWIEDIMSYRNPRDLEEYYLNEDSIIWKNYRLKDLLVYNDRYRKGWHRSRVKILPTPYSAIDIEYLKTSADNLNLQGHVIIQTSLKGYADKALEMKIYKGEKIRDENLILEISGVNYKVLSTPALLEHYTVNDLVFLLEHDYNKLDAAVTDEGVPMPFHDLFYEYALLTTVVVTGWNSPDDENPVTLSVPIWFVKSLQLN